MENNSERFNKVKWGENDIELLGVKFTKKERQILFKSLEYIKDLLVEAERVFDTDNFIYICPHLEGVSEDFHLKHYKCVISAGKFGIKCKRWFKKYYQVSIDHFNGIDHGIAARWWEPFDRINRINMIDFLLDSLSLEESCSIDVHGE